ncbi:MAG: replicative DNA helicase [Armatimonadetes bacterium]|nr:replicative DNA helicase [Armatimonadota bacterium]
MIDRIPPQNLEAEQGVLGSMLLERDAIARVVEMVHPEDFYREAHRLIYEATIQLFERGEPVDLITITDRLHDLGQLERVGGPSYLTDLLNAVPTAANVEYYARIVVQKSMLRSLIRAGTEIASLGYEGDQDVEVLVDRAEKLVFTIARRRMAEEFVPIRDILKETFDSIDRRYKEKGIVTGIPMGFTDLDAKTAGLQPADLIIVAARPGMGKCLKHDVEIVDPVTGEPRTIEALVREGEARLLGLDERQRLVPVAPSAFVDDGRRPVFRVRTALGRQVEITLSHPFLASGGWKPLHALHVGDAIAVPRRLPVEGRVDLPEAQVRLLAFLVSEGRGSNPPREVREEPVEAYRTHMAAQGTGRRPPSVAGGAPAGGDLPATVFTLRRERLALFLNRLLAFDGGLFFDEEGGPYVTCTTGSDRRARQIQHLLLRFGIAARVYPVEAGASAVHEVLIEGPADVRAFVEEIGMLGWESRIAEAKAALAHAPPAPAVDICWDRIEAIEPLGEHQVYDLTVPGLHNFVAADVLVHNTTFCLNVASHVAAYRNIPVAIFSLETNSVQLVQRMLCAEAEVDNNRLRTGFLADSDWPKLARAMGRLSEAPVYVDDSANVSVIEMRAKARKLKAETGLGLVIIDYLQLIHSYKRNENRTQEISEIARSLKSLAKELDIPIIAISQLSRAVELSNDKRPLLSHLRESGELEQVADLVLFIYREDYYKPDTENANRTEINIAKHRNGPTGKVELFFNKEFNRFRNLSGREVEAG